MPGGSSVDAVLTDTYDLAPGSLTVTKTIAGPAAGQQGTDHDHRDLQRERRRHAAAGLHHPGGAARFDVADLHRHPGRLDLHRHGDRHRRHQLRDDDGHRRQRNTHFDPAGGTATANITDTYALMPGALIVKKTITGPGAGLQGEITIQPTCGGTALPAFVIPAGTPAGFSSQLPETRGGHPCTITETGDGANSAVSVVVTGDEQVTVPPGGTATAERTDTYNLNPGSLVVNKTITGAGAGQQGPITITVTCVQRQTTTLHPCLIIPAGTTTTPAHLHRHPSITRHAHHRCPDIHRHPRRLGVHGGRGSRTVTRARWQC